MRSNLPEEQKGRQWRNGLEEGCQERNGNMELKVWVEGIQRIVCGVNEKTTCQDVVYALAQATGKTGRFTLVERWRNNERLLAPMEHPMKAPDRGAGSGQSGVGYPDGSDIWYIPKDDCTIFTVLHVLSKWGDSSRDLQFVLYRSPLSTSPGTMSSGRGTPPHPHPQALPSPQRRNGNFIRATTTHGFSSSSSSHSSVAGGAADTRAPSTLPGGVALAPSSSTPSPSSHQPPPYRDPPRPCSSPTPRLPPPYRDPPPPSSSMSPKRTDSFPPPLPPIQKEPTSATPQSRFAEVRSPTPRRNAVRMEFSVKERAKLAIWFDETKSHHHASPTSPPSLRHEASPGLLPGSSRRFEDLSALIRSQKEKLSQQMEQMQEYDRDLQYWQTLSQESVGAIPDITREVEQLEAVVLQRDKEIEELTPAEEEWKKTSECEKMLRREIQLLRGKLSDCEVMLEKCRGNVRTLSEQLNQEERLQAEEEASAEEKTKRDIVALESELAAASAAYERLLCDSLGLEKQVVQAEEGLKERKIKMENLAGEMKSLNLESLQLSPPPANELTVSTAEPTVPRKIVGSPRQLETAAPTPKNPQGIWV
ncbi:unnamed protein product [Cyprideis torosa]|uniref:Uncharacterized protein n=1 Tax=Cyprideis torosa TaxID=163714 RepID=A0A7R8WBU2_9CRUS|nr:unnamed protein product [Cyprideis torosa]CAG0892445.1 unnamed protein product [Cyprideis torosa]